MTDGPLVTVDDVSVDFAGRRAVDGASLRVAPGEIVTLIGPNGAGKTTLARAILGLVRPASGRIVRRPGLRIGYVPQRFAVEATLPMTVRRFLDLPHRRPAEAVREALAEVGAPGLETVALQNLSGGEFQRVALARALLRDPGLLVLDEPAQGVDFAGQGELFGLIERARRERGCGVLLVSHDLYLVMAATDRVICLNRHVCCAGRPEAVGRDPSYLALFGPAAGALAVYRHRHDHAHDLAGEPVPEERHAARV